MGVVYKLTDDIVAFILEQKKAHPGLSCRRLVKIVKDRFDEDVSKSSINSVIKRAELSSPVGRRPETGQGPLPRPSHSKRILVSEARKPFKGISVVEGEKGVDSGRDKPSPQKKELSRQDKENLFGQKNQPFLPEHPSKERDILIAEESESELAAPAVQADRAMEAVSADHMGAVFLKAAQWEMFQSNPLATVIEKAFPYWGGALCAQLADGDVFLRACGFNGLADLREYSGRGLGLLCGGDSFLDPTRLQEAAEILNDGQDWLSPVMGDLLSALTEAGYISLEIESGTRLYFDVLQNGVFEEPPSSGCGEAPMNKALQWLTAAFISNKQPVIIRRLPAREKFYPAFFQLLKAFHGGGRQAIKVTLHDPDGQPLASFKTVPDIRRRFIGGVHPDQPVFRLFADRPTMAPDSVRLEEVGVRVHFAPLKQAVHVKKDGQIYDLQGVVLMKPNRTPMGVILSNADPAVFPAREAVRAYILRWPSSMFPSAAFLARERLALGKYVHTLPECEGAGMYDLLAGTYSFEAMGGVLFSLFQEFARKNYFKRPDIEASIQLLGALYALPGFWTENKTRIVVQIPSPFAHPQAEALKLLLQTAILSVNDACVVSPKGQRLIIKS